MAMGDGSGAAPEAFLQREEASNRFAPLNDLWRVKLWNNNMMEDKDDMVVTAVS